MAKRHVDVVLASDLRLPGGTAQSLANEARAQHAAGLTTAVVQIASPLTKTAGGFAPVIQTLLNDGIVTLVDAADHVACDVLSVRHPSVAQSLAVEKLPTVTAEQTLMIVNQAACVPLTTRWRDRHTRRYDVDVAHQKLSAWAGHAPSWHPISPLVRADMQAVAPDMPLSDTDWVNIIAAANWQVPRTFGRHHTPVIGRHSRDDILKWPTKNVLPAVYPLDGSVEVAVLGGLDALALIYGQVPRVWRTYPFGTVPVKQFLASLDMYVYFHHPAWVEAFGRTILEALASGLPTVLDDTFAPLFGTAALYTDAAGVKDTVAHVMSDRAVYDTQVEAGLTAVQERFSYAAHLARLSALTNKSYAPPVLKSPATVKPAQRRVLFVSSNGAGVGHLMRLMAYANTAPDTIEPVFLTLSQGVQVVDDAGYFVEYLPSRGVSDAPARDWHPLLRDRLLELFARYQIETVVFDGTWPYQGLLDALILAPNVRFVWSRRALWKPTVKNPFLSDRRQLTDLVVEPGDAAESHDRGATVARRREATVVPPVRFIDDDTMLSQDAARAALNIPPDVTAVLVHLGAGNINDTTDVLGALIKRLGDEPNTAVYVTRSIIAKDTPESLSHVHPLSVYPLAVYLKAFDYAFAASGYNSFHELLAAHVPCGWVANTDTATDDQAARARYAAHVGIGVDATAATSDVIATAVDALADAAVRERMVERMRQRHQPNGAAQAMTAIVSLLDAPFKTRLHSQNHLLTTAPTGLGALLPERLRKTIDLATAATRPATYRRGVLRVLGRLPKRVRRLVVAKAPAAKRSRLSAALGLPTAVALPLFPAGTLRRVMVVCDEARDARQVDMLVDLLAVTARERHVAVLIVLRVPAFRQVRSHGLVAEYVPATSRLKMLTCDDTPDMIVSSRLADLTLRYGITDTVHVDPNDTPQNVCGRL